MQRFAELGLALMLTALAAVSGARADDYPSRPIRLIVGFPPGSAADTAARVIGDHMSKTLGQQIVIEAKPGAGSNLAAQFVARAEADGYTIYLGNSANVTVPISSSLRIDFVKDFAPITPLTGLPMILAVHPSLGVSSVKELIALAKSKPGELTYASVGHGTVPHLATDLFARRAGIKLVHVPYQGSPPALTDLLAARLSMMLGQAVTIMPHVESGKLIGLASASATRPQIAPNMPTMAEAGLPDFETSIWFGLVAPAGVPRSVIDKLNAAANGALKSPDVVDRLRKAGFEPLGGPSDQFAKFIAAETVKWNEAIKATEQMK
jgi:tripartite-type tricarboxylate transporter receptor subunit TctC